MRFVFGLIWLIFMFESVTAQTTITTTPGSWNTSGNWNNGVPADGGTATVSHNMTLNKNLNINNGNYTVTDAGKITDPSGGTDYDIDVRGTGTFTVSGNVVIGGDLEVRNFGVFTLKGCDTMIVDGDVRFSNFAEVTIESCAVLYINGNLDIRNDNTTQLDGNVVVVGDLTSRNSAVIIGTGNLQTNGEVDIRNSSSIFGSTSPCSPGPCDYGTGSGLPIVLLDFSVSRISCQKIELKWVTGSEVNNDYFTLESSTDGKNFSAIARVNGAGNSSSTINYSYLLEMENELTYFRLTQTDYNGAKEVFDMIALRPQNGLNCQSVLTAKVYPNPGNGNSLTLMVNGLSEGASEIRINDLNGAILYEERISGYGSKELKVNLLHPLKPGIYFLTLVNGEKSTSIKYIVVN
ncbi:T9SS type A sorting domain-containing protein [bacterium]|nr:T9SS type A sorting domain-containing protein [bacterium]